MVPKEDNVWKEAADACIKAAIRLLEQETLPTKEIAETVAMLADTANKFHFVPYL